MSDDLRHGAALWSYSGFEDMLLDEDRNHKYRRAIEQAIERKLASGDGAHFLDIGAFCFLLVVLQFEGGERLESFASRRPLLPLRADRRAFLGSGTGLLSLYAARAGATTITAIEARLFGCSGGAKKAIGGALQIDPVVCEVARRIAKAADYADRITFINADSTELGELATAGESTPCVRAF